jgi:hypothetical protein
MTSWRRDAGALVAIVVVGAIVTIALGERIGVNGGQGWDGMSYVQWARDFPHSVLEAGLTRYHSQRVLPSAIVHGAMRLAGTEPTAAHVITGFAILNAIVLALAAALWAHLAHHMGWRRPAMWVGFLALFGCFGNARHALYYPTLVDSTAFALGMAMIWAFLVQRPVVLWLVAVLGVVTWPAMPPVALALLVLPRPGAPLAEAPARRWLAVAAAAVATVGFIAIGLYYLQHPMRGVGAEKFADWVHRDLLVITLPLLAAMLCGGWYLVLREPRLWDLRAYLRALSRPRLAIAAAAAIVVLVARAAWISRIGTRGEGPSGAQFMCEHTLAALRGPLWGPVHHVVYFGPIILVAGFCWRRIARVTAAWGPSAVVAIAMVLAFAAGSQSRQWIHLFPFLTAATIAATHERWTARRALGFLVLAVAWSKLGLTIGYDHHVNWLAFPNQRYFMTQGPYASDTMYLVHLVAASVTAGFVIWIVRAPAAALDRPGTSSA